MPTTTRVLALELLSEAFGDWHTSTASAQGAGAGGTLIDTTLDELSDDDDFCIRWYVRMTSGNSSGDIRRIKSYDAATGTVTPTRAFTARIESSEAYELHRISPTIKHNALNAAAERAYDDLYLRIRDESIVIDDLLDNASYETEGGTTFTSWDESGGPTVTAETSIVFHGGKSAKVVAGGSEAQLSQTVTLNVSRLIGKRMTFQRWVWTDAASQARLSMDFGGVDAATDGDYHTGDSTWRLLTVTATVPTDAVQVKVICEVTANDTAYFDGGDGAGLFGVPVYKYTIPTSIIKGPHFVSQQDVPQVAVANSTFSRILDYTAPISRRLLRLEGMGNLTQPTTDAGTFEVGVPQRQLLIAHAARLVYRTLLQGGNQQQREWIAGLKGDWDRDIAVMLEKGKGIRMASMSADIPRGNWHIEESASGRFLMFDQNRGGSSTAPAV